MWAKIVGHDIMRPEELEWTQRHRTLVLDHRQLHRAGYWSTDWVALRIHTKNMKLGDDVDLEQVKQLSTGNHGDEPLGESLGPHLRTYTNLL
jgi:hypothetical protein